MGQWKNCKFAHFEGLPGGARKWEGRCLVNILTKDESAPDRMKYHTVMQHFECSNGKYQPLYPEQDASAGVGQ